MNSCNICNRKFEESELLQSNEDEYFCKECFKCEYCSVSTKKKLVSKNRCKGDALPKPIKMFPAIELSKIKQKKEENSNLIYTSKRPLQCPHVDCNRYVSIFDLVAHFQHEHMEVPITQTNLEVRNPIKFHPKDIRYGVKQCLILLNVVQVPSPDVFNNSTASHMEKPQFPVTVAVLASRIAAAQLSDDDSIIDDEIANETGLVNSDKIIIWTASNVTCQHSYTAAVSTVNEDIRVKYYGPVLQLGNSPKKLCKEGHCLILSHFHFTGMSQNGFKPLHLDIIIHSED